MSLISIARRKIGVFVGRGSICPGSRKGIFFLPTNCSFLTKERSLGLANTIAIPKKNHPRFLIPILGMTGAIMLGLCPKASAGNLTGFWAENGGYKMARQDFYPGDASSNTISRNWDGNTWRLSGAKNETVGGALYLLNGSSVDSTSTTVTISSFTGPGGSGIVADTVLCNGVTNYTTRPYELFVSSYLQIIGMTTLSWDPTEYEARDLPERFRRPCTVNVNGQCVPDSGTGWVNRKDANKFYPDILVPNECKGSFNVAKSSSQSVWLDVYISTNLISNSTYYANITIKEGVAVSTVIPVALYVYKHTLPYQPSSNHVIEMSGYDINYRHQGNHFPGAGEPYKTTRDNYARYLKRHKISATAGDAIDYCNGTGRNIPCPEYRERLAGTTYTSQYGFGNSPYKAGIGDPFYSIKTYGQWAGATWSSSTLGGVSGFDTNVSSWGAYFKDNYPNVRSWLYLTDEPASLLSTDKWSTWMSTVATSQVSGYTVNSWVTASALSCSLNAPYVTMPVTTFTVGLSSTWTILASQYQTQFSTQMWMYNSHPPAVGSIYATEEDGIAPVTIPWVMKKKGIQGWFYWQATNWGNPGQQVPEENDLFNVAKTFGFVNASTDAVKAQTGFNYANGDGVLLYPGTDTLFPHNSAGFDGPMGSWRLKMLRRGIQDADLLEMAEDINPSLTSSIIDTLVPQVLWEKSCFNPADCTYTYGGRTWPSDRNVWETNRETLQNLVSGATVDPVLTGNRSIKGRVTLKGGGRFK